MAMAVHRIDDIIEARTRTRDPAAQETIAFLKASEQCTISHDARSLQSVLRGCYRTPKAKLFSQMMRR